MKLIFVVFALCFASFLNAQSYPLSTYDGRYAGHLQKGEKELAYVNMFLDDSIYFIFYRSHGKENEFQKRYIGTFSINSQGLMHLRGKHPFRSNDFLLSDTILPCDKYELKWGHSKKFEISFDTRIQESLSTKKGYKIKLTKRIYNNSGYPQNWGYDQCCLHEFFSPRPSSIFIEESMRDSVFNEFYSKFGTKCNIEPQITPYDFKKDNYSEYTYFSIDSIRFDTLLINHIFLRRQNTYHVLIDTFCLSQTVKIKIDPSVCAVSLPEHTEIFELPDCESTFLYDRGEIDRIDKVRILDYLKDYAGVEWIKVELDLRIFNEEAEEGDEQYISKKITGWMLQKYLVVG